MEQSTPLVQIKGCSKFCVGSRVRYETPEGRRTYRSKRCEYNNKDDVNSRNILSNNEKYSSFGYWLDVCLICLNKDSAYLTRRTQRLFLVQSHRMFAALAPPHIKLTLNHIFKNQ